MPSRAGSLAATRSPKIPTDDSSARSMDLVPSYNEEWNAFIQDKTLRRSRSGFDHDETDSRPRVWNCPQR
ncbi:MAG: hypothetical protein V4640_06555 [Verrucomicrobiota bacterium]